MRGSTRIIVVSGIIVSLTLASCKGREVVDVSDVSARLRRGEPIDLSIVPCSELNKLETDIKMRLDAKIASKTSPNATEKKASDLELDAFRRVLDAKLKKNC
jgi:hypothetical protein